MDIVILLPQDILGCVLRFLGPNGATAYAAACKSAYKTISNSQDFWRLQCKKRWPYCTKPSSVKTWMQVFAGRSCLLQIDADTLDRAVKHAGGKHTQQASAHSSALTSTGSQNPARLMHPLHASAASRRPAAGSTAHAIKPGMHTAPSQQQLGDAFSIAVKLLYLLQQQLRYVQGCMERDGCGLACTYHRTRRLHAGLVHAVREGACAMRGWLAHRPQVVVAYLRSAHKQLLESTPTPSKHHPPCTAPCIAGAISIATAASNPCQHAAVQEACEAACIVQMLLQYSREEEVAELAAVRRRSRSTGSLASSRTSSTTDLSNAQYNASGIINGYGAVAEPRRISTDGKARCGGAGVKNVSFVTLSRTHSSSGGSSWRMDRRGCMAGHGGMDRAASVGAGVGAGVGGFGGHPHLGMGSGLSMGLGLGGGCQQQLPLHVDPSVRERLSRDCANLEACLAKVNAYAASDSQHLPPPPTHASTNSCMDSTSTACADSFFDDVGSSSDSSSGSIVLQLRPEDDFVLQPVVRMLQPVVALHAWPAWSVEHWRGSICVGEAIQLHIMDD